MLSNVAKLILFLNSYLPATAVVALVGYMKGQMEVAIPMAIFAIVGFLGFFLWTTLAKEPAGPRPVIADISRKDSELGNYLIGYLIPFLGLNADDEWMRFTMMYFFCIWAGVYVYFDLVGINPTLAVLGRRLYSCKLEDGLEILLIGHKEMPELGEVRAASMVDEAIYFELKRYPKPSSTAKAAAS